MIANPLTYMVNLIIIIAKFHIHEARFSKSLPHLNHFMMELNL